MIEKDKHDFVQKLFEFDVLDLESIKRSAFLSEYSVELMELALSLNNLGIMVGGETHSDPPEDCDICGILLSECGVFVDGVTKRDMTSRHRSHEVPTTWAYMCGACYAKKGCGLGWGVGQLYRRAVGSDSKTRWQLTAGGNPISEEDAD